MEYVTPPRGPSLLLKCFASDPTFSAVMGDLSEEFLTRAAANGQAAANRWYWREAVRNATVLARRELLRTPVKALAISLLIGQGLPLLLGKVVLPLLVNLQWAFVPPRFWLWFNIVLPVSIALLLYAGSGAVAARLLRAREFALAVSFATVCTVGFAITWSILYYSAAKGRLPGVDTLSKLSGRLLLEWAGMVVAYSLGCFWIRWRRLQQISS